MHFELKRYTARTIQAPNQAHWLIAMNNKVNQLLSKYEYLIAHALNEPYFVDDGLKHLTTAQYTNIVIELGGDIVIAVDENGRAFALNTLNSIKPGHRAEWGLYVVPEYRSNSVVDEVCTSILDYVFGDDLNLVKLTAKCAGGNLAARGLLQKHMRLVGVLSNELFYNERPSDTLIFEAYNGKLHSEEERLETDGRIIQLFADGGQRGTGIYCTPELQCSPSSDGGAMGGGGAGCDEPATGGIETDEQCPAGRAEEEV